MEIAKTFRWLQFLWGVCFSAAALAYARYLIQDLGMDMGEVALLNVPCYVVMALAQIPTGLCADRYGRGRMMLFAFVGFGCSSMFLLGATSRWAWVSVALSEMCWGVSEAALHGADDGWLKQVVMQEGRNPASSRARIDEILGSATRWGAAGGILGGLLGGAIGMWLGLRWVWAFRILIVIIVLAFIRRYMCNLPVPKETTALAHDVRQSIRLVRGSFHLKWLFGLVALLPLLYPLFHFWTPWFEVRYGASSLLLMWGLMLASRYAAGNVYQHLANQGLNGRTIPTLALVVLGMVILLVRLPIGFILSVCAMVTFEIVWTLYCQASRAYALEHVEERFASTILSLQGAFSNVASVLVMCAVWMGTRHVADKTAMISGTWLVCGSTIIAGACIMSRIRPSVVSTQKHAAPAMQE